MDIKFSIEDSVGVITLSGSNYNIFSQPNFINKQTLLDFFSKEEIKAIIIEGDGRNFSAGADIEKIKLLSKNKKNLAKKLDAGKEILEIVSFAEIPVLAVIKGSCFGAGLELALAAHFRFASKNSLLGFPESDMGLMPGMSGSVSPFTDIKRSEKIDLILSGEMINGEEACTRGLVTKVFSSKNVRCEALNFLKKLTEKRSKKQIQFIMNSINNGIVLDKRNALKKESEYFANLAQDAFMTEE